MSAHLKVTASHLQRDAYLYVRQSTLRQVFENTESTRRQYALRERAVALGWPIERVIVIDSDLGQSGATSTGRSGFQALVGEVGMGRAGIVLGLEVSRLARNCADWHRLLEICALRILSRECLETVAAVCSGAPDVKSPGGISDSGLACGSISGITSS